MTARQNIFVATVLCMMAMVSLVIWRDGLEGVQGKQGLAAYRFQKYVGGVGLGAVMVPAWNFSDYDPRLQQEADDTLYPLPGGYSFTPERLVMVSSFNNGK